MSSRHRGASTSEWDNIRLEYENSSHNMNDDDGNEYDACRLYVRNIPFHLNEDGLRQAFGRFGNILEMFLSADPKKRYALVAYSSPGEAKRALTTLHQTDPLQLIINLAKRRHAGNRQGGRNERSNEYKRPQRPFDAGRGHKQETRREYDDDVASAGSRKKDRSDTMTDDTMKDLDNDSPDEVQELQLQVIQLKRQEMELKLKQAIKKTTKGKDMSSVGGRSVFRDGDREVLGAKIVIHNKERSSASEKMQQDLDNTFGTGAGDSNSREFPYGKKIKNEWTSNSSNDGTSTPSTCVLCSDGKRSVHTKHKKSKRSDRTKTTVSSKKDSDCTSKRLDITTKRLQNRSDITCEFKYSDFYNDNDADETDRLIKLRTNDYDNIIDDALKVVIALAGYPKSKMRLRQMEQFQQSLGDLMDVQLKDGSLKKIPVFLDYYLNRGAIVCVCKDDGTRDWIIKISPDLQERMCHNLILLKTKVKRLCLAVLKIPKTSWPASAQDAFKLLQYFNPALKTDLWKIYAQKNVDNVECTSFIIDRVSGEVIRGPTFKNIIDYSKIEFELTGYTEIYYECLFSDLDDQSSVTSKGKIVEMKSKGASPRNEKSITEIEVHDIENDTDTLECLKMNLHGQLIEESQYEDTADEIKTELKKCMQKNVLKQLKDVQCISGKEVIIWSDEVNTYSDDDKSHRTHICGVTETQNDKTEPAAKSDKADSIFESNESLCRNSSLNIDSNRGIAYHRRTNYLHVENELKIAITLEGYPEYKLEGTHIRRLKHLFKEYLHKDMKGQRFNNNLILPKFQDIYLSNGAVIYICDSLETKEYLAEILPKFINSTGLKLVFRDIKNLVRYTRLVMRLPQEFAHVESAEILAHLKEKYPGLKPDCWKYYSDVAGKLKRQFGVEPDSLEVIKSPDFQPTYEGVEISFRIIDRQKTDISEKSSHFRDNENETLSSDDNKRRERAVKVMYVPIEQELLNAPLTRIRTNHYTDLIADDQKLYVGPLNYPQVRIDEVYFYAIKRCFENLVIDALEKGEMDKDTVPKFHDIYLFDGVIFIICESVSARYWVESILSTVSNKCNVLLKSSEFRGAVGIISMSVVADIDTESVINMLQEQNPRLRTKFWRQISTVKSKGKLDVVLQIDKLSAQVIANPDFKKYVNDKPVQFKLGHLQSLLKPKSSYEELKKVKKVNKMAVKKKSKVIMQAPKSKSFEEIKTCLKNEYPGLQPDFWDVVSLNDKITYKTFDLEIDDDSAKIIEKEDFKLNVADEKVFFYTEDNRVETAMEEFVPDYDETINTKRDCKVCLKIPISVLPDNKDDLNVIFDILEDKNPGLNTELWHVLSNVSSSSGGKVTMVVDRQSAVIIKNSSFDSTIGGQKLKFSF